MTLTFGLAPFASKPFGSFNFAPPDVTKVLYWADFLKRFRIRVAGETVADSRQTKMLHETDGLMRLCVPPEDVRSDLLEKGAEAEGDPSLGSVRNWSRRAGDRMVEDLAISFERPPAEAEWLKGYFAFDIRKADKWFEEDEEGYAHPRDPFHRADVRRSSRHVVVRAGDHVVAETRSPAMLFETSMPTRYYVAPVDVRTDLLSRSPTVSQCPYKGDGQHWHIAAGGARVDDAAWSLPEPLGDATAIPGWFCFYPDKVSIEVDGEHLRD